MQKIKVFVNCNLFQKKRKMDFLLESCHVNRDIQHDQGSQNLDPGLQEK